MPTSARSASLLARRSSSYKGYRVLSPVDKTISTIQKSTFNAEYDSMWNKYDRGEVSNDSMKSFLQQSLSNNITTPVQKADIQSKLVDIDNNINEERLVAAYKSAPQNTLEQIQAAQALSNYYKGRATNMSSETPAQSQMLQNAAGYDQKIVDINSSMIKTQRANTRAQLFNEVAKSQPNSLEEANKKVQAYQELANQARADGDQTTALQLETYAQNEQNKIPGIVTKADKQAIVDWAAKQDVEIAKLTNGSPSELQAKIDKAKQMADAYQQIGDGASASRYTALAIQTQETLNNTYTNNATKAVKDEINSVTDEISKIDRAYKYGQLYTPNVLVQKVAGISGDPIQIDGLDYAGVKKTLYDLSNKLVNQQMSNGVKGLEDDRRRLEDAIAKNDQELQKRQNGEIIDVVSKSGQIVPKDVSDPNEANNYVKGNRYSYQLQNPTSAVPGSKSLSKTEISDLVSKGLAYVATDANGQPIDSSGNVLELGTSILDPNKKAYYKVDPTTGVADTTKEVVPKYIPEAYIEVPTSTGSVRLFTKHDDQGNFTGYIKEPSSPAAKTISASDTYNQTMLNQKIIPKDQLATQTAFESAKQMPADNQQTYFGVDENGKPFTDTQAQTFVNGKPTVPIEGTPMPKSVNPPPVQQPKQGVQQAQLPAFKPVSQNIQMPQQAFQPSYKEVSPGLSSYSAPSYKLPDITYQDKPTTIPSQGLTYSPPVQQPQKNWWDQPIKTVQNVLGGIGSKIKGFFGF